MNKKIRFQKWVFLMPLFFLGMAYVFPQSNNQKSNFSILQLKGTDQLGRQIQVMESYSGKAVGVFYSLWLGQHKTMQKGNFDIQKLLNTKPDVLNDPIGSEESPLHQFHFWGEPLYGYYSMADPWIVSRHIELLTNAAIDYLCIDATNNVIYEASTINLLTHLQKFQKQGFKVPKVVFYTNSHSGSTVENLFKKFYQSGIYEDVWYKPNGKPLIIGITPDNHYASDQTRFQAILFKDGKFEDFIKPEYLNYFEVKESEWPNGEYHANAIPWMSWQYPQWNHQGSMAIPVAQHSHSVIYASSLSPECSRGYNNITKKVENNWMAGPSFQNMWDHAIEIKDSLNNVLITSFNEWMAIKYVNDKQQVYFVDVYNHEYSRDIEMMKGGYGDNFYMQLVKNVRDFKFNSKTSKASSTMMNMKGVSPLSSKWDAIPTTYFDFEGDALPRDFEDASGTIKYQDQSNRNDIVAIKVCHDQKNIYFHVRTKDPITKPSSDDLHWMNIWIKTKDQETESSAFQYVLNRKQRNGKASFERSTGGFQWKLEHMVNYQLEDQVLVMSVPLKSLGLSASTCQFEFKVTDNLQNPEDPMDFYVSGDAAPIGRLNYAYGY